MFSGRFVLHTQKYRMKNVIGCNNLLLLSIMQKCADEQERENPLIIGDVFVVDKIRPSNYHL